MRGSGAGGQRGCGTAGPPCGHLPMACCTSCNGCCRKNRTSSALAERERVGGSPSSPSWAPPGHAWPPPSMAKKATSARQPVKRISWIEGDGWVARDQPQPLFAAQKLTAGGTTVAVSMCERAGGEKVESVKGTSSSDVP